jgi:hypothetical protein
MRAVQGLRAALVILWLTILLTGCGSDSVAPATLLPTAPTPSPIVPMGPLVTLTGQVTDAAGAPMNATVSAYPLGAGVACGFE